jgi:hypothetical protein
VSSEAGLEHVTAAVAPASKHQAAKELSKEAGAELWSTAYQLIAGSRQFQQRLAPNGACSVLDPFSDLCRSHAR